MWLEATFPSFSRLLIFGILSRSASRSGRVQKMLLSVKSSSSGMPSIGDNFRALGESFNYAYDDFVTRPVYIFLGIQMTATEICLLIFTISIIVKI